MNSTGPQTTTPPPVQIRIEDLAVRGRALFGTEGYEGLNDVLLKDWRLVVTLPDGSEVIMGQQATAQDVFLHVARLGYAR